MKILSEFLIDYLFLKFTVQFNLVTLKYRMFQMCFITVGNFFVSKGLQAIFITVL